MRLTTLSLAVLASSAAAVPHRRHGHPHPVRRDADVVTEYIVETDMAVLYVDQNGNPVSTSAAAADAPAATDQAVNVADHGPPNDPPSYPDNQGDWPPQPIPTTSPQDSTSEAPPPPPPETTQAPPASSAPAPDTYSTPPSSGSAPDTSAAPPQSAPPTYGDDGGEVDDITGFSIAYAGYNGDHSCKTKDQVDADVDELKNYGYKMVRIYGTDCDQVPNIMGAAKRNGMQAFLGVWDVDNAAAETQLIIDGVNNDWDMVHTVSVGNEVLNRGGSLSSVINGINTAKSMLVDAGYSGPVTTVEVYSRIMMAENKGLCDVVDYIAANCHPFFNSGKTAEQAGSYVKEQAGKLSDWCGDKRDVVITETGWPTGGQTNGMAVPGASQQRIAVKSLREAYVDNPNNLVLFSAYDDPWKEDSEGTFGTEKFWGIYGMAPSAR